MDMVEKQCIQALFTAKDYMELYRTQKPTIDLMLGIEEQWEFEDFLEEEDSLEEVPFWLYYSVIQGDFLEIGGYEEDVTEKVVAFLQKKLPKAEFHLIVDYLRDLYVDIDERDNLEEKMGLCNQYLACAGYSIQVEHDDTYCTWDYFLSVQHART